MPISWPGTSGAKASTTATPAASESKPCSPRVVAVKRFRPDQEAEGQTPRARPPAVGTSTATGRLTIREDQKGKLHLPKSRTIHRNGPFVEPIVA